MLLLTGEYRHNLDAKGRVLVSNRLRAQIDSEEHGSSFYLVLGANGILCLYPEKYYERLSLGALPEKAAPDEAVSFERMNFGLACRAELDNQGRLLVPEPLRARAGLEEEVTLVGVRDHIELWNAQSWERYVSENMGRYQKQIQQARLEVLQNQKDELQLSKWRQDG